MKTSFSFKKSNFNFFLNIIGLILLFGLILYAPNLLVLFLISSLSGLALYLSFFYNEKRSLLEGILISVMLTTYVFVFVQILKIFSLKIYPWMLFLLFIILPLIVIALHFKKFSIYFKKETYAQNIDLFFVGAIAVISVIFFSIYLTGDYLPREDGPLESYLGLKIKNEFLKYNTIYHWNEDFFVGVPQIPLESAVTYYRMAVTNLLNVFNEDYHKDIANLQILFSIFMLLGAYLSFRAAKIRESLSFFGVLLLYITAFPTTMNTTFIRKIFPVALIPLILFLMIKTLRGENEIILIFLSGIAVSLQHPIFGLGSLLYSSLFLFVFLLGNAKNLIPAFKSKNLNRYFLLKLMFVGILLIGLAAFYIYNLAVYLPDETLKGISYNKGVSSNAIINIGKAVLGITSILMTPYSKIFGYFMIVAIIYLFFVLYKKDAEEYGILKHLSIVIGIYLLFYYLVLVRSNTLSAIWYDRMLFFNSPVVVLFFLFSIKRIKNPFRSMLLIIAGIVIIYSLFAVFKPNFTREIIFNEMGNEHRKEIPVDFRQYMPDRDNNRFTVYCMNYFENVPEILLKTDLDTSDGNVWEMQSLLSWRLKHMLTEQSNRILPRLDHPPIYWKNFMRMTNTKYAVVNFCGCPVNLVPFFSNNYVKLALTSQCLNIYEVDTGAFAEKVTLSYPADPINNGLNYGITNISDNPLYDLESGYKHVFPREINKFIAAGKKIIVIHNESELNALPEPIVLKTEKISDEHYSFQGNFENGDFVFVKMNYFKMWKAYMGGNSLKTYDSNTDLTLIETAKGNKIEIIYEQPLTNKFLFILFLVSFISLLLLARNFEKSMPADL